MIYVCVRCLQFDCHLHPPPGNLLCSQAERTVVWDAPPCMNSSSTCGRGRMPSSRCWMDTKQSYWHWNAAPKKCHLDITSCGCLREWYWYCFLEGKGRDLHSWSKDQKPEEGVQGQNHVQHLALHELLYSRYSSPQFFLLFRMSNNILVTYNEILMVGSRNSEFM